MWVLQVFYIYASHLKGCVHVQVLYYSTLIIRVYGGLCMYRSFNTPPKSCVCTGLCISSDVCTYRPCITPPTHAYVPCLCKHRPWTLPPNHSYIRVCTFPVMCACIGLYIHASPLPQVMRGGCMCRLLFISIHCTVYTHLSIRKTPLYTPISFHILFFFKYY